MTTPTTITSQHLPPPIGVWSHARMTPPGGRLVYLSGLTSRDSAGTIVAPDDISGQTRQVLTNLLAFVEEQGASPENILKLTVFATDVTLFDQIHAVRREFFPADPPPSSMVQVVRLVEPAHMIEIDAVLWVADPS